MILNAIVKSTGEVQELEINDAELMRLVTAIAPPSRLTMQDMAKRYGKDARTIRRWVTMKLVPYFKIGGSVFFDPAEIDRMERQGTIAAAVLPIQRQRRKTNVNNSPRS